MEQLAWISIEFYYKVLDEDGSPSMLMNNKLGGFKADDLTALDVTLAEKNNRAAQARIMGISEDRLVPITHEEFEAESEDGWQDAEEDFL